MEQTIAVVGGTGNLGAALARRWAKAGKKVIIGSRTAEKAQEAAVRLSAGLDTAILSLADTGTGDQLQLRRLKKMKLDIKDKIQAIENMLIPDIIA